MRTWQQAITAFTQYVGGVLGNVEHLATDDKSSIVAAINEVKSTVPVFADGYDPNADGVWSSGNLLHRLSSLDNPSTLLEADPDWGVTAPTLEGDAGDQTVTLGGVYARLRTVERFPVWPGSLVWASVDLSAISDLPGERSAYLTMSWYDDEDTLLGWSNANILDLAVGGGDSRAFFPGNDGTYPTATHVRPGVAIAYPGQGVAGEQYAVYGLQIAVIGPSLSRLYGLVDLEGRLRGNGLVVEPAAGSDAEGHHRYSVRDEDTWDEFAADSDVTATADGGTRARGTLDAPEAVELGDILRYLWRWEGHDGTGYSVASVAYLQVDDVVSEGVVPTALVIEQADADGVLQETLRIASDGTVTASGEAVVVDTDARLTDARTPTAHAASHASAGSDPVTLAQNQVTNLTTDLAAKAPLRNATDPATGISTIPRYLANTYVVLGGTGVLHISYFRATESITAAKVTVATGNVAAGATPTLCRFGLFSVSGSGDNDSDLTLIASTANDTSLFAAQWTTYTRNFSTPVALTQGTLYAVGVLVVSAATMPNFMGIVGNITNLNNIAPMLCGQISGQSDVGNVTGYVSSSNQQIYYLVQPA